MITPDHLDVLSDREMTLQPRGVAAEQRLQLGRRLKLFRGQRAVTTARIKKMINTIGIDAQGLDGAVRLRVLTARHQLQSPLEQAPARRFRRMGLSACKASYSAQRSNSTRSYSGIVPRYLQAGPRPAARQLRIVFSCAGMPCTEFR